MATIVLDGSQWKTVIDFCDGLLAALKPLGRPGSRIGAFVDSMICGGMSEREPPYQIFVERVSSPDIGNYIKELSCALAKARMSRREVYGDDIEVSLKLAANES